MPTIKFKDHPAWLSVYDAAECLGCSHFTIRRMIARGELRAYATPGRTRLLRIKPEDLDRAMRPVTNVADNLGTGDAA